MKAFRLFLILAFVFVSGAGTINALALPLKQGGVSDGGGDSIGSEAVSPDDIAAKIPELSQWILPWLYKNQNELNTRLAQLIKNGSVQVRLSEPCYDKNGQPKDGSIFAPKENQVCISALLLSEKLNKNNYEAELAALLIHEFSHFLGTSEEQAVELQKKPWVILQF